MELDQDADGFIEISELQDFLKSVGEPLTDEEMQAFTKNARDETSDRPNLIDVKRLVNIILPKIVAETELSKGVKESAAQDTGAEAGQDN